MLIQLFARVTMHNINIRHKKQSLKNPLYFCTGIATSIMVRTGTREDRVSHPHMGGSIEGDTTQNGTEISYRGV